ncbi:MAG: Ig-like domain-containing protein, partial [Pseudomonadota bacterium]|nr:Ig-like domain-containing protein [Pseudomonadota bacterium]
GGVDASKFAINATTGALSFVTAPDFEAPTDNGADNTYQVQVRATDARGNASAQAITVTVADVDETVRDTTAPIITAPGGGANAAVTINENGTAVAILIANEAVTWSINGGADAAKFVIDAASGVLRLTTAPDFEAPTDSDANNSYLVQVMATDASGNAAVRTITVTVADLDDTPPAAPGLDLLASSDSGSSATDNVTNVAAPVIRVTLNGSGAAAPLAGEKVTLFAAGVSVGGATLSAQDIGAGFVDVTSAALGDGIARLTATLTDGAGNVSGRSDALVVTIDTTAPAAPAVNQATVFTATPTISGNAPVGDGERLSVLVNGVNYTEGDGKLLRAGGTWTLTIPANDALPLGSHSVTAILTDVAGNSRADTSVNELLVAAQPTPAVQPDLPAAPTAPIALVGALPAGAQAADAPTADASTANAPTGDAAAHAEPLVSALRTIDAEISHPIPSAPALIVTAEADGRAYASADVAGILTVRGNDAFQVIVMPSSEPALMLYRGVPDQDFDQVKDARISFRIPADAFMHTAANATVKLVASLSTGGPLPAWLVFSPSTGRFDGTVPADTHGEIVISIKAIDMEGRHAETIFRIKLVGKRVVGRLGLAEQLRLASTRPAGLIPLPRKAA